MDFGYLFTSLEGRINRKPYWMGTIVMIVVSLVVTLLLAAVTGISSSGFRIGSALVSLLLLYPAFALMAKRLQDRNRPTWWAAFILVPLVLQSITNILGITGNPANQNALDYLFSLIILVVGIWFFIELGCLRGTVGPNQYGPDPLEPPQGYAPQGYPPQNYPPR